MIAELLRRYALGCLVAASRKGLGGRALAINIRWREYGHPLNRHPNDWISIAADIRKHRVSCERAETRAALARLSSFKPCPRAWGFNK